MNGKRMAGAIAGGLVAGLGITAMMMAGEKKSGIPSELTDLERAGARQFGVRSLPSSDLPDAAEQAIVQGIRTPIRSAIAMARRRRSALATISPSSTSCRNRPTFVH